jgi:hypothetical protein
MIKYQIYKKRIGDMEYFLCSPIKFDLDWHQMNKILTFLEIAMPDYFYEAREV